ncbi:hypothetical protein JZ751_021111 [Albula glossodonta]|uniref:Uncharacterized protein n=1 Tax=Albula glossodonta TaxID=121402 RepID=A0A8T2PNY7_9TELE|nr:hypothetical protein JZ751_021111 [Albula glossodonta]
MGGGGAPTGLYPLWEKFRLLDPASKLITLLFGHAATDSRARPFKLIEHIHFGQHKGPSEESALLSQIRASHAAQPLVVSATDRSLCLVMTPRTVQSPSQS